MPATYDSIASTTITSGNSATITFSSIPGTYTDLRLVFIGFATSGNTLPGFRLNGASTNCYWTKLMSDGSTSYTSISNATVDRYYFSDSELTGTTTAPMFGTVDIFSYASTSVKKTMIITGSNDKNGSGYTSCAIANRPVTAAITSIDILAGTNNFGVGTTATLYGILRA